MRTLESEQSELVEGSADHSESRRRRDLAGHLVPLGDPHGFASPQSMTPMTFWVTALSPTHTHSGGSFPFAKIS